MGYFSPLHKLFKAVGEPMGSVQSRELGTLAPPSEVYYAGKLQWHFTCGFDFRHSPWLQFVAAFAVLKGLLTAGDQKSDTKSKFTKTSSWNV